MHTAGKDHDLEAIRSSSGIFMAGRLAAPDHVREKGRLDLAGRSADLVFGLGTSTKITSAPALPPVAASIAINRGSDGARRPCRDDYEVWIGAIRLPRGSLSQNSWVEMTCFPGDVARTSWGATWSSM